MKLISLSNLQTFKNHISNLFVTKETGKGLSTNDLTDELVEKINNAGAAAEVAENIATAKTEAVTESKEYAETTASAAKTEAIESSNSYTDAEVSEALTEAKTYADTAESDAVTTANAYTDTTAATAKSEAVSESKTYADEQVAAAKTELQTEISSKIATAYKVKGSSAFASLPAPTEAEEGGVWNVTDEFTTTANFIVGEGQKYPAGTNVVCIEESEGVYKYDILHGFIDTDSFVLNSDIEAVTEGEIDAMFA